MLLGYGQVLVMSGGGEGHSAARALPGRGLALDMDLAYVNERARMVPSSYGSMYLVLDHWAADRKCSYWPAWLDHMVVESGERLGLKVEWVEKIDRKAVENREDESLHLV